MPGPQQVLGVLALLEHDLHRHALHDFDVVAGRVFRRQQAEARAGGGGDAVHVPLELAAPYASTSIVARWPGSHVAQLRLLEIGRDPDVVERDDGHQRLAGLHDLADFDRLRLTTPLHRRLDRRVLRGSARPARAPPSPASRAPRPRPPARASAPPAAAPCAPSSRPARACCSVARACASWLSATGTPASASSDLRSRRVGRRATAHRTRRRPRRTACCDTSSFGEQAAQPLDVARRLGRVRLRLAQPRLGDGDPRVRGVDLILRPRSRRSWPVRPSRAPPRCCSTRWSR